MDLTASIVMAAEIVISLVVVLQTLPLLIWMERKASSYIQNRRGPAYAHIGPVRAFGMVHTLTDVLKLWGKEDVVPRAANRFFHALAPCVSMFLALLTFAVIPFADYIEIGGTRYNLQVAELNVGILYLLAVSSLGVYGIILAAWSSNNKYSMLGGLRSSAQMISYELALGFALISVLLWYGSVRLGDIVHGQGILLFGAIPHWGVIVQPVAFIIFITSAFAETNRNPFDLPEGESEIVAGFHTEYSSFKFAMFFMAEYAHIFVASALTATLFFGGYQIPFVSTGMLVSHASGILTAILKLTAVGATGFGLFLAYMATRHRDREDRVNRETLFYATVAGLAPGLTAGAVLALTGGDIQLGHSASTIVAAALQFGCFMAKTLVFCFLFIWVRWTLPRFRYDQLMKLGWKYMIEIAIVWILITAAAAWYLDRPGM